MKGFAPNGTISSITSKLFHFSRETEAIQECYEGRQENEKNKKKKVRIMASQISCNYCSFSFYEYMSLWAGRGERICMQWGYGDPHVFHLGCCCIWLTSSLACWYCSFSLSGPTETSKYITEHKHLKISLDSPRRCHACTLTPMSHAEKADIVHACETWSRFRCSAMLHAQAIQSKAQYALSDDSNSIITLAVAVHVAAQRLRLGETHFAEAAFI